MNVKFAHFSLESNRCHLFSFEPHLIRILDFTFASMAIFLTLPIMFFIMFAIKINSRGSAFYVQERLGQHEKVFRLIKFRTMRTNAEANGPTWAQLQDDRVTTVGKFLRKTRLDELPQLFNVLKSDLCLVGPRPIRKHFADILRAHNPEYSKRFLVKPGITGWAQIYAPYGSTVEEQLEKLPYDLSYLNGLSLTGYFRVLLKTVRIVLRAEGV